MRASFSIVAVGIAALAVGCGDDSRTVEDNLEQSKKVMEDGYDAAREKGDDALEAAGDAYNEVIDEGKKKAE